MRSLWKWAYSAVVEANWLTASRANRFARIILAGVCAGVGGWLAFSHGGLDPGGKPVGTDFVSFWTASRLALEGRPEAAWDPSTHFAQQTALFGPGIAYARFLYPPTFLLICLPLALLPYFASLATWLSVTFYGYFRALRVYSPELPAVAALAFPAVLINGAHGQNGFLSAALIGGALGLMNRRPALAGVLLGMMAYKPHLAAMLPIALLFSGRMTTLIAAALTALTFCGLSFLVFGEASWLGFFADLGQAQADMESNFNVNERMQSFLAAVRLLHGPLGLAYGVQAAAATCAAIALYRLRRKAFRRPAEAPAAVCACLTSSPYLFDYDLTLLAIPLVWLTAEGRRTGFRPGEKSILAIGFLLPLVSRLAAIGIGLPLAPVVIGAIFALVIRRAIPGRVGIGPRESGAADVAAALR